MERVRFYVNFTLEKVEKVSDSEKSIQFFIWILKCVSEECILLYLLINFCIEKEIGELKVVQPVRFVFLR
jgi:hypothetical protein